MSAVRPAYKPYQGIGQFASCSFNGINVPVGGEIMLDNRTVWGVGEKYKLDPLVTVTRDGTQPINSNATRFDSAQEMVSAIE